MHLSKIRRRMWSLPSFLRAPDTTGGDTASFFALGVFSGIASSCCAPVLAGVMTLSALSGSAVGGRARRERLMDARGRAGLPSSSSPRPGCSCGPSTSSPDALFLLLCGFALGLLRFRRRR